MTPFFINNLINGVFLFLLVTRNLQSTEGQFVLSGTNNESGGGSREFDDNDDNIPREFVNEKSREGNIQPRRLLSGDDDDDDESPTVAPPHPQPQQMLP